jgi:hypothetical protein
MAIDTTCLALLISIFCNFIQAIINIYKCYYETQERIERRRSELHLKEIQPQHSGIWI